jgi:hypothetical protein
MEYPGLAMPVRSVNIVFIAAGKQVPAGPIALLGHHKKIAFGQGIGSPGA